MKLKILLDIELDKEQSAYFGNNRIEVANAVLDSLALNDIGQVDAYLIKSLAKGTIKKELPICD